MTQASTSASIYHVSTLITLTDINWDWSDTNKGKWEASTDKYQQFYDHWCDRSSGFNFLDQFPYKLSLGVNELGASLLPFGAGSTSENRILVTKSYDAITTVYCFSTRMMREMPKERCSLGSPTSVRLSDPYPVRQLTSASFQEKPPS
jgi:hypothetical protein